MPLIITPYTLFILINETNVDPLLGIYTYTDVYE